MQSRTGIQNLLLLFIGLSLVGGVAGCNGTKGLLGPKGSGNTVVYQPPNASFAQAQGISQGPITADQAKSIAAAAAGGTAVSVETEDEDGTPVFGVIVQVGQTRKDVKVRISDGAVTKIEDDGADNGTSGERQGE